MKRIKDLRSRFGFHATPFTRELPLRHRITFDFFDGAFAGLMRSISDRMSAALIAPAGTGKTALIRAIVDALPAARYRVHYVKVTSLCKRDMCREIAAALEIPSSGNYPTLVRRVQEHFGATHDTSGLRPVLILDEAHDMRPDVLAILRILTNFDMDSRLVVSIILAGQPLLRTLLRRDQLESVARRLAHIATLRPLCRDEAVRYIEHRCTVVGAKTMPFDPRALDAIYEIACGNLRATDRLALAALQLVHEKGKPVVGATHVVEARRTLWP